MEIKLDNVCSNKLESINILFSEKKITSLIGNSECGKKELINLIYGLDKIHSGVIKYGRKKIDASSNSKKCIEIRKMIYYLREDSSNMLFNINIKEDIKYHLDKYDNEKLCELLKSFNLDNSILEKCYLDLSSSEIRKIQLIIGLMSNSKVIILENPTIKLDNKSIQTLIKHLKKIKREDKIIIINSYNTNFLLEVSDEVIVMDNNKIIDEGSKFDILSNEKLLNKINLKTPNILHFINKVKKLKNKKISYSDNINDLIKDIFRYAK